MAILSTLFLWVQCMIAVLEKVSLFNTVKPKDKSLAALSSFAFYNTLPLFIFSPTFMTTVQCPTCQNPVPWQPESTYRPFCSQRCKLIDLGQWASEQHTIATQPESPEEWETLLHHAANRN